MEYTGRLAVSVAKDSLDSAEDVCAGKSAKTGLNQKHPTARGALV